MEGGVLITGASSGIGKALALRYANPKVTLFLGGRHSVRLNKVSEECRKRGATVFSTILSVNDEVGMNSWIIASDTRTPLNLVIANAGISGVENMEPEPLLKTREIFSVNVLGSCNTVIPAIEVMLKRGNGQIALMSSIAGFIQSPKSPAYNGSKWALRGWSRSLRLRYKKEGIKITVIYPGFVKTPMTDKANIKTPFVLTADEAADQIVRSLKHAPAEIKLPRRAFLAKSLFELSPEWLKTILYQLFVGKTKF